MQYGHSHGPYLPNMVKAQVPRVGNIGWSAPLAEYSFHKTYFYLGVWHTLETTEIQQKVSSCTLFLGFPPNLIKRRKQIAKVCLEGPKGRGWGRRNNTDMTLGISALGLEKGFGKEARRRLGKLQIHGGLAWLGKVAGRFSSLNPCTAHPPPHRHQGLWEVRVGFKWKGWEELGWSRTWWKGNKGRQTTKGRQKGFPHGWKWLGERRSL